MRLILPPSPDMIVPLVYDNPVAVVTWTSMQSALNEFGGNTRGRMKIDLSRFSQVRIYGTVIGAGAAGAELRLQYSLDQNTWNYLDGSTGPSIAIDAIGTAIVSSWRIIVAAARADVFVRLVGINGNNSASPTFNSIGAQFR